jgi:FAD-dependent urate hydroxylase
MRQVQLLVVGAGPYGIAVAAYAKWLGIDVVVVGKPLDLWKTNMPRGMFLRSAPDWHLDARNVATFEAYLSQRGPGVHQARPVALETFLDYAGWFMGYYDVVCHAAHVTHLARTPDGYMARLDDDRVIRADQVVLALGFGLFKWYPRELVDTLPSDCFVHTCDAVDLERYRGRRVLIVGGRQSAFEWAALMNECGAIAIDLTYRHVTPKFTEPDWSWTLPMARRLLDDHGWWRDLPSRDRQEIVDRFWATGRLTLEPWLDARVHRPNIHLHELTRIVAATRRPDRTLDVVLDDGKAINVHHVVLATGYRPDMRRVAFLDRASIVDALAVREGHPVLGAEFQTSLPGLYVTGLAATRDFGPFFGFTVASPIAARIIGDTVATCIGSAAVL